MSIEALVLTYLYPRIDVNVSTGINHLLKSPWCVHPKTGKYQVLHVLLINVFFLLLCITGKICVPIDPRHPDSFDCTRVPTLTQVINEIGQMQSVGQEEGGSTTPPCLEPFMRTFKAFLEVSRKQNIAAIHH